MTTSGITSFMANRDTIVRRALRMVGAFTSTDAPRPEQTTDAVTVLNLMLKAWSIEGLLWLRRFAYNILTPTNSYTIGDAGHCVTAYTTATTSAAASAGASSITLTAGHGLTTTATGWLLCGSQWIQNYSVSSNTITFTSATLDADLASGATVYAHADAAIIERPLHIYSCNRKAAQGNEVPMISLTRTDWMAIPNKTTQGTPVQYYYDPQTVDGVLYVWPTPQTNTTDVLVLDVDRQLDIMNDNLDNFDFPMQWQEAITYNLAARLAPEYGLPLGERQSIEQEAAMLFNKVVNDDRDIASIYFGVRRP